MVGRKDVVVCELEARSLPLGGKGGMRWNVCP